MLRFRPQTFIVGLCFYLLSIGAYGEKKALLIVHTNDIHSQILPTDRHDTLPDLGGALRRQALIDSLRHTGKAVLLVDAGDAVQGTAFYPTYHGAAEMALMNHLGYDFITPGNHEFDYGPASLAAMYAKAQPTIVNCNYGVSGTPLEGCFSAGVIKEIGGWKVGITGVSVDLKTLVGNGYVVITITPSEGERYQGVVGLEGDTLAACLEDYFMRSEQLPTRLFIRTGDVDGKPAAGGMLLQVMPAQNAQQDDFDHLATLTETIKTEELLTLPANEVLWRLYHEEEVTVYDPQDVEFKCTCSRERCADALKTLPDEEVDSILAEDGEIDMHCDYCGNHYLFNAMDIAEIRNNASPADPQVH